MIPLLLSVLFPCHLIRAAFVCVSLLHRAFGQGGNTDNDVGDVTDESPVEGLYNPQMEGKARCVGMCVQKVGNARNT